MLLADATALIALGEVGRLGLLQHYDPPVVIGPAVEAEVIRSRDQVAAPRAAGWLQVEQPDQELVLATRKHLGLDAGEAEIIVLASRLARHQDSLLIDEGRAFAVLLRPPDRNTIPGDLMCLAQVLHTLEERDEIPSAAALIQAMLDNGAYAWARDVREHYEALCERDGNIPLPGLPSAGRT